MANESKKAATATSSIRRMSCFDRASMAAYEREDLRISKLPKSPYTRTGRQPKHVTETLKKA